MRYSAVFVAILLLAGMASAQRRGGQRGGPPGRPMSAPPQLQRNAPPPSPSSQPAQPAQQDHTQRPFDRFILHGPGPHAGDWLRSHETLTPQQQQKELQADPGFQKLSPARQAELLRRLNHFNSLPIQQRDRILQRMETLEHLTPNERQRARAMFHSFRQLPVDRRRQLNRALYDLDGMSPEDREKALDSDEYRAKFTDQERDLLRGMSEMRLVPSKAPED